MEEKEKQKKHKKPNLSLELIEVNESDRSDL